MVLVLPYNTITICWDAIILSNFFWDNKFSHIFVGSHKLCCLDCVPFNARSRNQQGPANQPTGTKLTLVEAGKKLFLVSNHVEKKFWPLFSFFPENFNFLEKFNFFVSCDFFQFKFKKLPTAPNYVFEEVLEAIEVELLLGNFTISQH